MSTVINLAACILLYVAWLSRGIGAFNSIKLWLLERDNKHLKGLFKVVKLFSFDIIITICTMYILGGTNSIFGLKMIIWINALTTFFGEGLFELSERISKRYQAV